MNRFNQWVRQQIKDLGMSNRTFCELAGISMASLLPQYEYTPQVSKIIIIIETIVHIHKDLGNITTENECVEMFHELLWEGMKSTNEYQQSLSTYKEPTQ
jgi:predicted transcriptional regulator